MRNCACVLSVLALVVVGCATAPHPTVFSNSQTYSNDFDSVWTAVIETFADNSWPIDTLEKASGLVTGDWLSIPLLQAREMADCGKTFMGLPGDRPTTMKFNVFVKASGMGTEMRVTCVFKSATGKQCLSKGIIEGRIMEGVAGRLGG